MSKRVFPMFSSKSLQYTALQQVFNPFGALSFCMVLQDVLILFFYMQLSSFPSTTKGCLFSTVYPCLLCCRLIDCRCGVFWAFYSVPLIYISIFVSAPYCFHDCRFQYSLKSGSVIAPAVLLPQDCFDYSGFFCFHKNFKIIGSSSGINLQNKKLLIQVNIKKNNKQPN